MISRISNSSRAHSAKSSSGGSSGGGVTWDITSAVSTGLPDIVFSNNNLTTFCASGNFHPVKATNGVSTGKYWWELNQSVCSSLMAGVVNEVDPYGSASNIYPGNTSNGWGWYVNYGQLYGPGGAFIGSRQGTVGFALDCEAKTLSFYDTGGLMYTWAGLTGTKFWPALATADSANTTANFGASAWTLTPPSGHVAIPTGGSGGSAGTPNAWGIHGSNVALSGSNAIATFPAGPNGAASAAYATGGVRQAEIYFDPAYTGLVPMIGVVSSGTAWNGVDASWGLPEAAVFQAGRNAGVYGGLSSSTITNNGTMPVLSGHYVQVVVDYAAKTYALYYEGTLYFKEQLAGTYPGLSVLLSGDDSSAPQMKATINTSGPFHNTIAGTVAWK